MTKPQTERDPLFAAQLRKARETRNLTQTGLERLAGVSRKHISDAEQGANISLAVLTKLMRALGMREITVGGDLTIRTAGAEADVMRVVADQIDRATDDVTSALTELAAFIRGNAERARHAESAEEKLRGRAAALAMRFTEQVRRAKPHELTALEASLNRLVVPSRKTSSQVHPKRKRAG